MPVFVWEGRNRQGALRKGEFEAATENAVMTQLRGQQLSGIKVKPKSKGFSIADISFGAKVTTRELVIFTRQFATMIDAGLPLVQCLDIIASQQENKFFKKQLFQVKEDVEGGATFADSLRKQKPTFDELYINLVAAGEVGGILDVILSRLAAYMEKMDKLARQIKGAMVYPAAVLAIAILVVGAMLIWVIPVFQQMFEDFGGVLPMPTQIVVNMSEFLRANLFYMIAGMFAMSYAFKRFYSTNRGRRIVDDLVLKLPIFGGLIQKVAIARFSRTLGTMVSSGVPILDALEVVAKTAGNKTVEIEVYKARESIAGGKTIAEPLGQSKIFPSMVVQMVSVGESTGAMDTMLSKIADFYEDEVDAGVAALTSLIEPLLMVFLGGAVGGLLIAMYLPIFKISDAIH